MPKTNSILVVSDKQNDIMEFRSKLMLLRDIDSIISTTINKALEFCRKYIPDTVIVFTHTNETRLFEICKAVRLDPLLKNIPIIFIFDKYDEEFILSSFDAGINDYLILPVNDSEVLIRAIWSLQKSEMARELEKKESLLKDLGVIDKVIGAYTAEFIPKVVSNEINTAIKYKYPFVLMALCLDAKYKSKINEGYLSGVIKKSIRNSDILGIPETGKYYVIMPKTNTKGAYTVYSRIQNNLMSDLTISCGICEFSDGMNSDMLSSSALNVLDESMHRGGNRVIICDKYENNIEQDLDDAVDNSLSTSQDNKKSYESFREDFTKKVNRIITPVFNNTKQDIEKLCSANILIKEFTTDTHCYFSIKEIYGDNEVLLKITDPGFAKVIIDIFFIKSEDQVNKRSTIELEDLTEDYIVQILENIFDNFKKTTSIDS